MRNSLIISFLFLILSLDVLAQTEFAQLRAARMYMNPAYASSYLFPEVNLNYSQSPNDRLAMQATAIYPLRSGLESKTIGAIGLNASYVRRGVGGSEKINGYYLCYSQNIRVSKTKPSTLSIAVQGGMEYVSVDFSSLWGSQFSPYISNESPNTQGFGNSGSNFILNGGIVYQFNVKEDYKDHKWSSSVGISGWNLNQPNKSISRDNALIPPVLIRYSGEAKYFSGSYYLEPTVLIQQFETEFQFNIGTYIYVPINIAENRGLLLKGMQLVAGTWYRIQDSFIFILGIEDDQFGLRMSYDLNENFFYPNNIEGVFIEPRFEISGQYRFLKW